VFTNSLVLEGAPSFHQLAILPTCLFADHLQNPTEQT